MKKRKLGVLHQAAETSAEVRGLVPAVVFLSKQGSVLTWAAVETWWTIPPAEGDSQKRVISIRIRILLNRT